MSEIRQLKPLLLYQPIFAYVGIVTLMKSGCLRKGPSFPLGDFLPKSKPLRPRSKPSPKD